MAVSNRVSKSFQPQSMFKETVLQEEFESDQHASIVASNIARLRNGQYSDFQVHAGAPKRKSFQCHKVILLVSSEYFRSRITSANQSSMSIKEVEPEEFEGILDYIYKGKLTITTLNVERILNAAHLLSLEDLKRGCVNFLLKTLDPDNCLRYWRWAKSNELPRLSEACRTLTERDFYRVMASPDLFEVPESVMRVILHDDELDVYSEVDVAETAMRWMEGQTRKDKTAVYYLHILQKIRWSGVSDMYVRRRLLDDPRVTEDPAIRNFLLRVLDYLSGGSPFAGLVTVHRPLTGIEKCVFIVGVVTESSVSSDVIRVSLQRPESSIRDRIATQMRRETAACVCPRTNALFVSGIGTGFDEIWQWTGVGGWNRCDHMNNSRRRHCMVFANETSLFLVGGFAGSQIGLLSSVEKYDTRKEICMIVGDLVYAVDSAACIADYNILYVFGGGDREGNPVNHVQAFDTTRNICSLLVQPLPRPAKLLRAVVWDRLVIVTCLESCFIYDLDKQLWHPRHQFRSGRIHFGCVVENQRLYVFGGGNNVRDPMTGVFAWILSDQIRYVPVADIVEDKPAQWMGMEHHRLPLPCLVHAYAAVTAATGNRR